MEKNSDKQAVTGDPFVKLYASILDSSIWLEDSDTCKVWITLLAMGADDDVVRASVRGLAHRAKVSDEACERAIEKFLSPDPDSKSSMYEGRRIEKVEGGWKLLNANRFRTMRTRRQILTAERVARHRRRKRYGNEVTARNAVKPLEGEREEDKEREEEKRVRVREGGTPLIPPTPEDLLRIWNSYRGGLPEARTLTEKRIHAAKGRLHECPDLARWSVAVTRISVSKFCLGLTESSKWVAHFDWLLRPDTLTRIEEGRYDDRKQSHHGTMAVLERKLNEEKNQRKELTDGSVDVSEGNGSSQDRLS